MTWQAFKEKLEAKGDKVGEKEKIFWEISRCSDRHSDYMLMVMEHFDKLSNEEKIEVVQMLWGSLTTNRLQLYTELKKREEEKGRILKDPTSLKPEYFFGSSKKWE